MIFKKILNKQVRIADSISYITADFFSQQAIQFSQRRPFSRNALFAQLNRWN